MNETLRSHHHGRVSKGNRSGPIRGPSVLEIFNYISNLIVKHAHISLISDPFQFPKLVLL